MICNLILGIDWLVIIYYELECLRIANKTYVNLEEDIHISSISRLKYTTLLKSHSAAICYGKIRQNPGIPLKRDYQISAVC